MGNDRRSVVNCLPVDGQSDVKVLVCGGQLVVMPMTMMMLMLIMAGRRRRGEGGRRRPVAEPFSR